MNRKRKKQMVTTVVAALFFLAGGVWYLFQNQELLQEEEKAARVTSILEQEEWISNPEEQTVEAEGKSQQKTESSELPELLVHVCGAVNQPGVYVLESESRLYEAVALAGGFSKEADTAYHNLARIVTDGERIYILSTEETRKLTAEQQAAGETGAAMESVASGSGLVNINTADHKLLMELPGIGESRASAIIEYRMRIGNFTAVEEIKNVSGIGESMFEKIKDKITVQ